MKITGGQILKVSAEKTKDEPNQGMNVNISINSLKVEKENIVINYTYSVQYAPDLAKITVVGEMHAKENEKAAKEIQDKWTATKTLPDATASEIITAVTYTGSAVGTLLAFAVGVPAPINIQKARIQNPKAENKAA